MHTQGLNEVFDIETTEEESHESVELAVKDFKSVLKEQKGKGKINNQDLADDYDYVRSNMYNIIEKTNEYVSKVVEMGEIDENPKAFFTANELLKTSIEASKVFIDTHAAMKKIVDSEPTNQTNIQINADTVAMSQEELAKLLEGGDE